MADENNQDMAMEDILSSIKNILEEEQAVAPSAPAEELQMPEVEDDDILELSPNMRLPNAVDENHEDGINLDAELDDIQLPELGNESADMPIGEENEPYGVHVGWEDFESDPFYEEPKTEVAEEMIGEVEAEDVVQEDEETFVPEMMEQAAEPEPEPDLTPAEVVFEPEPVEEPVQEVATDDAVDVSASIISNFAKMFSKEETAPVAEVAHPVATEVVRVLGDGSKTIEDVVASVIRQIIGDEVATGWRQGVNYDILARQEVSRQTKEWLDSNLPAVVEKIVKQEIERVMAKVGTNQ